MSTADLALIHELCDFFPRVDCWVQAARHLSIDVNQQFIVFLMISPVKAAHHELDRRSLFCLYLMFAKLWARMISSVVV